MKKLLILTTIILLNSGYAMANGVLPKVEYPTDDLMFIRREKINPTLNVLSSNTHYSNIFNRPIIYKTENMLLKKILAGYGDFVKIVKKDLPNRFSKQYRIISIMPNTEYNGILNLVKKQVSIFVNNEIVAYYLLSPIFIDLPDSDPTYIKMKSLTLNANYLADKITIPQDGQLKVYETEHSDYIERYITYIHYSNGKKLEYLLGEIFYPKELDGEFDSKIIDAINTYTYRIDRIRKAKVNLLSYDDILEEFKNPLGDMEY